MYHHAQLDKNTLKADFLELQSLMVSYIDLLNLFSIALVFRHNLLNLFSKQPYMKKHM
jgi:hypothetical protein